MLYSVSCSVTMITSLTDKQYFSIMLIMPKHTGILMPNLQHNTVLNRQISQVWWPSENATQDQEASKHYSVHAK